MRKTSSSSAVPGKTVNEIRKIMQEVRTKLENVNEIDPFVLTEKLTNNQTVSDFVYDVAHGLHVKRTKKRVDKTENDTVSTNK